MASMVNTREEEEPDEAKKRSPCAAEGEEKRDNTQGLEGYTHNLTIPVRYNGVKRIPSYFS
ncbi:MAG TPA: hypothetical protein PKH24_19075 [Sedimentisphaerales bacterium]|jgi:hypothetical protein|nr:hypothetical protein [Sedimentisphaerales bacterium]HNU31099.1 hypothetical protein [Sedimentisphaerales bacterium]